MKTNIPIVMLLFVIFIFTTSCDRSECRNVNTTFDKFSPDTKEYKRELAKQIQSAGAGNLSYWFEGYIKKKGKEFILINIYGTELCAKGEIQVNDWSKLGGLRREVSGYRGAELRGFTIDIMQDSTGTHLVYAGLDKVID